MNYYSLAIILSACIIIIIYLGYKSLKHRKIVIIRDVWDITGLLVASFKTEEGESLNFVLDTGSNLSFLNSKAADLVNMYDKEESDPIVSSGGVINSSYSCEIELYNDKNKLNERFVIADLDESLQRLSDECNGLPIHGFLGGTFFDRYNCMFNYCNKTLTYKK